MIATPALAWVLTIGFVLTGAYALLRWSATMTGPLPRARRTTELAHLLMSVSMLLMTWTWFGSAGLAVQVALFALFTAYFVVRACAARRGHPHACAGGTAHALAAGAMVWMLVSMPLIMPTPVTGSAGGGGHAGHAGHGGGASTDVAMPTGAPAGWAVGLTLAGCVALLVACGYWAMRAARRGPDTVPTSAAGAAPAGTAPSARTPGPITRAVVPAAPEPTASPAGLATLERTATRPSAIALSPLIGPRSDAGCHAVMCLAMAAMLLAMVAGW